VSGGTALPLQNSTQYHHRSMEMQEPVKHVEVAPPLKRTLPTIGDRHPTLKDIVGTIGDRVPTVGEIVARRSHG